MADSRFDRGDHGGFVDLAAWFHHDDRGIASLQPINIDPINIDTVTILRSPVDTRSETHVANRAAQLAHQLRRPTIAAVNGVAYAGGFLPAQNCDLVVASSTARFAVGEVKVGRGAPWAAPLSWLVPPRVAMEILLTGDPLTAQRAYEVGLVNRVVAPDELVPTVQELAERIAANARLSVAAAKRTAYLSRNGSTADALEAERIWDPVYRSADAQEGPAAFRDNRSPVWTGR